MLNLTNPVTTICRAITRAIGMCHEVAGDSNHLARLFNVPPVNITLTPES